MATCSSCGGNLIPGSLFCDSCGASQSGVKVARKLRQASFDTVKDAGQGLLAVGERLKYRRQSYIVEEAIARSGFGATFRALSVRDKKQVLIKQMLEQSSYDQFKAQLLKSFKREAKFIRRVKHPAFPRGFQYFERNKSFYLIMEFINGKELAKAMDSFKEQHGKVPDGLVVYLGIEISDALDVLHDHGFIYRDMKPQNVMLDGITNRVKLIDFGTLYSRSDKDPLVFESEGYTPPEFLDANNEFTEAGDIYSLGALLYEAATGETPSGPGDTKALDKSGRDKRLCEIIKKCLKGEPKERYQSARALTKDLKKLTRRSFWPFTSHSRIETVEISVLPKTLYPSGCTFCEYCGYSDAQSQVGYCPSCRVPLRVGILNWKKGKEEKEFFLYSDESTLGSSKESHVSLGQLADAKTISPTHARIFRKGNSLWLEAVENNPDKTKINKRRILGPLELLDGDTLKLGKVTLSFSLKDAC